MSCIDGFELELPFEQPQLVVDAMINTEGTKITIGWSRPVEGGCFYYDPFTGKTPVSCEDLSDPPYAVTGNITITEEGTGISSFLLLEMKDKYGFKNYTSAFKGTPGKKYLLHIEVDYQNIKSVYESEAYMHVTPSIYKMSYEIREGDIGKQNSFVPLIYFIEPKQEKNYYLFQLCEASAEGVPIYCGHSRVWSYSLMDDVFLPEHVMGLSIDDGATIAKYGQFYPYHAYPGVGTMVKMYSVERETYQFYKDLIDQFNNDGGAYTHTPATPRGNITGGAIGLFRAVHESRGIVYQ